MVKLTQSYPDFTRLHYVSLAVPKKDKREYLNYLYVDADGRAIGADGHRLHFATATGRGIWPDPGFYRISKRTKTMLWLEKAEVDAEYPNLDHIIKGRPNGQWKTMKLTGVYDASIVGYWVAKDYDLCAQHTYIEDAITYSSNFNMGKGKDQLWFSFDGGDVQAVIMSLAIQEGG